ncbi:MAG: hypothetical protein OEY94_07200 [Alphaproteobacteria bacterium]|nr:hypothetical protein [Alphaproteobacteria bacterium]
MGTILVSDNSIKAQISLDSENLPFISFDDPAYIRAETVIFKKEDCSVHAVLYEGQFLIGHVPKELNLSYSKSKSITLSADHFTGKKISLTANLVQY